MKKVLFLFFLLCSVNTWAQDVIVKKDGSAIVCRIINVSSLEIVYKKWTDLQGPNSVMSVADAISITYENGEKKVFKTLEQNTTTSETLPLSHLQSNYYQPPVSDDVLLAMTKKAYDPKKSKRLKRIGWAGAPFFLAGGIATIATSFDLGSTYYGQIAGGVLIIAAGAAWTSIFLVKAHKAKSQYSVQSTPIFQNDFTLKNGTTLSTGIDMLRDNARHNPTLGVGLSYNF